MKMELDIWSEMGLVLWHLQLEDAAKLWLDLSLWLGLTGWVQARDMSLKV